MEHGPDPSADGLSEPEAFARLRRALQERPREGEALSLRERAKRCRKELYHYEFERCVLNPFRSVLDRLAGLARLQAETLDAFLSERDRADIALELDRYGMRVLWNSGFLEAVIADHAPAHIRAAALLDLIGRGAMPAGLCARAALHPAKTLLAGPEARSTLVSDPALRDELLAMLEAAERRTRLTVVTLCEPAPAA